MKKKSISITIFILLIYIYLCILNMDQDFKLENIFITIILSNIIPCLFGIILSIDLIKKNAVQIFLNLGFIIVVLVLSISPAIYKSFEFMTNDFRFYLFISIGYMINYLYYNVNNYKIKKELND